MNRRQFLAATSALALAPTVSGADPASPEARQAAILKRIKAPVFPKRDFDITKYGAIAGVTNDSTPAIANAIAACAAAGGGRVVVPAGEFLTGAIHLENNVNLYISQGATLKFSQKYESYLPVVYTRWEGTECMNYSPFIYAYGKTNVGVSGPGTLDGQASSTVWWPWKGGKNAPEPNQLKDNKILLKMGDDGVPVPERVFGGGHYLRPNFIQPYKCTNVLIEGVTILNSPMWEVNPVLCKNVTVRGVKIDTHGANNDGCDPESCTDVLIEDCVFNTGDDCIAIKSGRNADGRRVGVACSGLIIRNCTMQDGHGGVSIGSEVSGGIRDVFVENCKMSSPHLQRALRIKTNSYRGGTIENIWFRNVTVGEVSAAVIDVDFYYEDGEGGPFKPAVNNVVVENVTAQKSKHALYLRGYRDAPIRGLTVTNCNFGTATSGNFLENVQSVKLDRVTMNGQAVRL